MNRKLVAAVFCLATGMTAFPAQAFILGKNKAGQSASDVDVTRRGPVSGVGLESQDIVSMTDQMVRDLLSTPAIVSRATPPQIILDSRFFSNDSSQRINKDLITNRLRISLNRASVGRLVFVGRQYADMVGEERELKRAGMVDIATTGLTQAQAGGDFRLAGSIGSLDSRDPSSGTIQRYTQVAFELIDLERGTVVWSGLYEIGRAATDDIVYR